VISLVIPTFNRAPVLKRALRSAKNLDYSSDRCEIIVVDNGSTDATAAVVKAAQDGEPKHKIHYIREQRLGLHNARHAGVWAAKGNILVFTDDDATFDPGWLRAYAEAFESHPEMVAAGGPVRPSWEAPPPKWLLELIGDSKTFGMFSLMETYGDFRLDPQIIFFGVNMAIRRNVLIEQGGFNPDAFGDFWLGDGETGLNYKLRDQKMPIGYVPEALVYHHIPTTRMTVKYLRLRMANQGICNLYSEFHRNLPRTRSLLKRAANLIVEQAGCWIRACLFKDRTDTGSLHIQLEAARTLAELKYMVRIAVNKRFQHLVLKTDWLNDVRPLDEASNLMTAIGE
jgi:glycosyltransferase involved in cell wall biosynthesis